MTTSSPPQSKAPAFAPMTAAVMWMGLSLLSFSAIAIAGRESGRVLPTTELIFWRSLIGVAVLAVVYRWQGAGADGPRTTLLPLHGVRSLIHFAAQYSWLYALTLIPLVELFALEFTAPLWVTLFAPMFLGERLTGWRLLAATVGFIGALCVVEPGIFQGRMQFTASTGTLYAVAAALGFGASMLLTKRLTRVDPALRILFWMQVLQATIAAVLLAVTWIRSGQWPLVGGTSTPPAVWGWVAVIGIAGLTAHFGLTRAFKLADAIVVAPMDFLRLPLIALIGAVVYGEALRPGLVVGAAIVVLGNAINLAAEARAKAITRAKADTA